MAKEMIISSSAHEKKIAIVEDGIVTEYYVERSDETQGIAGSIYKGRVMKVLPGMQSAFVDIGLERDAFLYVSDFFEEEGLEEFEEIAEVKDTKRVDFVKQDVEEKRPQLLQEQKEPQLVASPAALEQESLEEELEDISFIGDNSFIDEVEDLSEVPSEITADVEIEDESLQPEKVAEGVPERVHERVEDSLEQEGKEPESIEDTEDDYDLVLATDELLHRENISLPQPQYTPPASSFIRIQDDETEEPALSETEVGEVVETVISQPDTPEIGEASTAEALVTTEAVETSLEATAVAEEPEVTGKKKRGRSKEKEPVKKKAPAKKRGRKAAAEEVVEPVVEAESAEAQAVYERIIDDEIEDEEAGELLKDALVQQKIVEQIRKAEFEVSLVPVEEPEVRVGSLQGHIQASANFERVVDDSASEEKIADVTSEKSEDVVEQDDESKLSDDLATDGGESDESRSAKFRSDQHQGRQDFSMRRGGGRRRGRRGGSGGSSRPPMAHQSDENLEKSEPPSKDLPINRHHQPVISELLHEGQEIMVQIAKEPIALKGARITSHIALPGRYLVYMPTVNHIGVSRKIGSDSERLRLKRIILSIRDKEKPSGGFIVRTACEGHTEQELHDDMMYLVRTWQDIKRRSERTKAPSLVYRELDLVQRSLRDLLSEDMASIRIDNETEYAQIVDFVNRFQPKLVKRVKLYTWQKPIFEEYGIQEEIDKAIKPRVWLRSGGYIVINQTEALVAIDVNTGKFVGRSNRLEDTITKTNLEAVKEIVRQIRLRDLGGIIVLDFIDMEERKNRLRVMQALEQELKADRAPSKVLQFNDFGLVAITRKRVRQSLERTLCSPCPYCEGSGLVKSPQTVCYEILAEARRIAAETEIHPGTEIILRINNEVAEALRGSERKVLSEIEAHFGCSIKIKGDAGVHQERFDFAIV